MAFSENDLKNMGLKQNPDGSYSKGKTVPQPRDLNAGRHTYKVSGIANIETKQVEYTFPDRSKKVMTQYLTFPESKRKLLINNGFPSEKSILTIDGIVAGLNGDKGLMRAHWTKIKKIKKLYAEIIRLHLSNRSIKQHSGKVKITYRGYKSILMDWDNFCSSFKHIGDSLVKAQIITDDKPSIVTSFIPEQVKCKRIEQRVVVIIEDVA